MLDLDHDVVGEPRPLAGERLDDAARVRGTVQEVGIAERDVLRASGDLGADIAEHSLRLHDPELPVVHRHNRTVPAPVLAAAGRLRVADDPPPARRELQRRIPRERG